MMWESYSAPKPHVKACRDVFGVFPCGKGSASATVLALAYGYVLMLASQKLCKAAAEAPRLAPPLLAVASALPCTMMILISAAWPSQTDRDLSSIGVGALAGCMVLILTLGWGGAVLRARAPLLAAHEQEEQQQRLQADPWNQLDLTASGVALGASCARRGRTLLAAAGAPLLLQLLALLHASWLSPLVALTCALTLALLLARQGLGPSPGQSGPATAQRLRHCRYHLLACLTRHASHRYGGLLLPGTTTVNTAVLQRMFRRFDRMRSGVLSPDQLCELLAALGVMGGGTLGHASTPPSLSHSAPLPSLEALSPSRAPADWNAPPQQQQQQQQQPY
ncbi:hypothetical protein V8C86DRAFT_434214 [Haematococcus lacustris]